MNYLERNALLIAEINGGVRLSKRDVVGWSQRTRTTALGSYSSNLLGQEIFVALKETRGGLAPEQIVVRDLAWVCAVADGLPDLRPELPLFLGLLRDKNGLSVGMLTEDFSKGGKYKLWEVPEFDLPYQGPLPEQLRQFTAGERGLMDPEELANMFFRVGTVGDIVERRLGDFDKACLHFSIDERLEKFPREEIEEKFDLYTVRVSYDL